MANDAEVQQYVNERNANRAAEQYDRPTYAWTLNEEVVSGTLVDYAEDLRLEHYSGHIAVGENLWTGDGIEHPHTHQEPWDGDDYARVRVWIGHVNGRDDIRDEAFYSLDGRA